MGGMGGLVALLGWVVLLLQGKVVYQDLVSGHALKWCWCVEVSVMASLSLFC